MGRFEQGKVLMVRRRLWKLETAGSTPASLTGVSGCSLVWLKRMVRDHESAGSSPVTPTRLLASVYVSSASNNTTDEGGFLPGSSDRFFREKSCW